MNKCVWVTKEKRMIKIIKNDNYFVKNLGEKEKKYKLNLAKEREREREIIE